MAVKKGKGKKKDKGKKVNNILKLILASVETISTNLIKLEKKLDSFTFEPKRQGQRVQKGDLGPVRSTGAPGAGGGRGQRVTKKKTIRKKSVAGKVIGKKVITKKTAAKKATAKKKVTGKKAVARSATRKKTVKRRATTKKVAPKKTRAKRR